MADTDTMTVRCSGQTFYEAEYLSVMTREHHITISVDEMGRLVIRSVSAQMFISPAGPDRVALRTRWPSPTAE